MKKIIYTRPDGGLSVVHPSEGARLANAINREDGTTIVSSRVPVPVDSLLRSWPVSGAVADWAETEDEFMARIAAKDVPAGVSFQIVEGSAVPADRTFRDAWKAGESAIEHDMGKCRAIHRDRLRALRAPLLRDLDIEYQRADEVGDIARKAAVATKKQALRDVTDDPAIDAAKTPEELKAVTPEALR